jgi:hypothetical protein
MTTIMFRRGSVCLVADIIQTVIEPLDAQTRQVVFFVRDSAGNKYRVQKSDVVAQCASRTESKVKKDKKKKGKCVA